MMSLIFSRIACLPIVHMTQSIKLLWCTTQDFIVPDMWPPNAPDLNLVDYAIWSSSICYLFSNMSRVYETRVHDIDKQQQCLLHVWCSLEQSLIDDAVDQWPTCLHAHVHARGGHFEHALWLSICFLYTWWTLHFTPYLMQQMMFQECIIKEWNVMFHFHSVV